MKHPAWQLVKLPIQFYLERLHLVDQFCHSFVLSTEGLTTWFLLYYILHYILHHALTRK